MPVRWGSIATAIVALLALAMPGCKSMPGGILYVQTDNQTPDGLYRVLTEDIAAVFLRPGANVSQYDAAAILPLTITYKSPPRRPSALNRDRGNFALGPQSTALLKNSCTDRIEDAVREKNGLGPSNLTGPRTLIVRSHIVDLEVNAPPPRGGQTDFVRTMGSMMVIINVQDSETGETLIRIADRREIQTNYQTGFQVEWVNIGRAFDYVCSSWARGLDRWLRDTRALPSIPKVVPDDTARFVPEADPHRS